MSDKKKQQLGMNPSTASGRLRKDVMFMLAKKCNMDICYQCSEKIETVEEFSIEHKEPWLDSEEPLKLFFDMDNISFSHLKCNVAASRKHNQKFFTKEEKDEAHRLQSLKFDRNPDNKIKRILRRRKRFEETGKW